jgi:hypothetical protein
MSCEVYIANELASLCLTVDTCRHAITFRGVALMEMDTLLKKNYRY